MRKYFKTFDNHSEYEAFTATTEFILPNVSFCRDNEDVVHYNPSIKVTSVTLDKGTLSLSEGDTDTLVATVLPNDASNKNVIWSSSDSTVASVDSNGAVSGVSVGNANITVTTIDGGFTAQCATSVKNYKVITYAASAKLRETTSTSSTNGLHVNSFSGTSGQKLTMVSHTFEDGVGTVTFNDNIVNIGDYAFYTCSGLTSIDIPDSVTSIGDGAFENCSGLTSIDIPDSVTSIGDSVFCYCSGATSCTIGSGVTSIDNRAFLGCTSLTRLNSDVDGVFNIPSGVTSIGERAFTNCSSLTSIDIPDTVTSIGVGIFQYCYSLSSCTIGSGVTSIGSQAFYSCSKLTSIDIPDTVTSIGASAFVGCSRLTSIDIPDSVASISDRAFQDCISLTSIDIPSGVTSIGNNAFRNCSSITSIDIPNSVTSIGTSAFTLCYSLSSCTIGSGVTSIGDGAFHLCTSLTSIMSNATTAPTITNTTFQSIKRNGRLTVPSGSSGYDVWMGTGDYYLGLYNWTKVEQ